MHRYSGFRHASRTLLAGAAAIFILATTAQAFAAPLPSYLARISVSSTGAQLSGGCFGSSISGDGRYVAFASAAAGVVPGYGNGSSQVYVRDRLTGAVEIASVSTGSTQGDGSSGYTAISADGRYVAFVSNATNLVTADTNGTYDVFVRDRVLGTTERVDLSTSSAQANGAASTSLDISADGRYVAFVSDATNLVTGDTNGTRDAFVRDRQLNTTARVSLTSGSLQSVGAAFYVAISGDGQTVAFVSSAADLVSADTNAQPDVFLRKPSAGSTVRVSVSSTSVQGDNRSGDGGAEMSLSSDGRYVAFSSWATNLVAGDTNSRPDIFVRDTTLNTTTRVSVAAGGAQGNDDSLGPSISGDGRYVAFGSQATNLAAGVSSGNVNIFVRDLVGGTTRLLSYGPDGHAAGQASQYPRISANGRHVSFDTMGVLLTSDTNSQMDVYAQTPGKAVKLSTPALKGKLKPHKTAAFVGKSSPGETEYYSLTLQRFSKGKYRKFKSYTLLSNSEGVWKLALKYGKGKYRLRAATIGSHFPNLVGTSAWKKFTVK